DVIERLFNVVHDGTCLVHHEITVLENRYAIERMQRQVSWFAHLRFEVAESVGDILVGEHQSHDLNKSAARESKYNRIRHRILLISPLCPGPDYNQSIYGILIQVLQWNYVADTVRREIDSWSEASF